MNSKNCFWRCCWVGVMMTVSASAAPLQVVTTTTMLTDLVQIIGGEDVVTKGLMGPGVDPHLYKAASSDLRHLSKADIVIYNGLYLEGKMSEVLDRMGRSGKTVYAVGSVIPRDKLIYPEDFDGHADPHIWGDVALWVQCADSVAQWLAKALPGKAGPIAERGKKYKALLQELDSWARTRAASLPESDRVLFTSHDAFNYFGRAYGFRVLGVQGISTVTEAGLGDVSKSIEFIKSKRIKAIFAESSVSSATIQKISQDSGAVVGGKLFSDAMGSPGDVVSLHGEEYDKGTYIGMMKHNVNTIVDALNGKSGVVDAAH